MIEVPRGSVEYLYVDVSDELSHLTTLVDTDPRFDVAKRDTNDWLFVGEEAAVADDPLTVKCLVDTRDLEDGEYDLYIEFDSGDQTPRVGPMSFRIVGSDPGEDTSLASIYQKRNEKGQANGYASLDSGGKVPTAQLPSGANTLTYEDTITYDDLLNAPIIGRPVFRTIPEGSAVVNFGLIVVESFDFTGADGSWDVDDSPGGTSIIIGSDLTGNGDYGGFLGGRILSPDAIQMLPVKAKEGGLSLRFNALAFSTDGTAGSLIIFTTVYTPDA